MLCARGASHIIKGRMRSQPYNNRNKKKQNIYKHVAQRDTNSEIINLAYVRNELATDKVQKKVLRFNSTAKTHVTITLQILRFNFVLGSNFISICFGVWKCMIMSLKQRKIKFKPRKKLNHNIYIVCIVRMEATCSASLYH